MDKNNEVSFPVAAKDFFGLLPGQSVGDFARELKSLTDEDRSEMAEGLRLNGYKLKA